jgi:preprotein translocase subunit SecF
MVTQQRIIDFMRVRHLTSAISVVFILISLFFLATKGLNFGLDFTGGTQIEVRLDKTADLEQIRELLEKEEIKNPVVVLFGSDQEVLIRTQDQMIEKGKIRLSRQLANVNSQAQLETIARPNPGQESYSAVLVITNTTADELSKSGIFADEYGRVSYETRDGKVEVAVEKSMESVYLQYLIGLLEKETAADIELLSSEFVGPQIGDELRDRGGIGMIASFALIFLYVAVQFQWKFSVGAIAGLVHDTIITLGFFAAFQWDFDLTVLAAVLAMVGYSINDTIVIYDRIRENFRILRKMTPHEVINISITQTLGRTIMTSITVYLVLFCLYFIAGETLQGFALALIIGILVGTYSSIYICANITAALDISKEDMMPKTAENSEADSLP